MVTQPSQPPPQYPEHPKSIAELDPAIVQHAAEVIAQVMYELALMHPEWQDDETAEERAS